MYGKVNRLVLAGMLSVTGICGAANAKSQNHGAQGTQQRQNENGQSRRQQAQAETVEVSQMTRTNLTVESVDKQNRQVTVKSPDDETITVTVPRDVGEFDQIREGDRLDVTFYQAVAMSMDEDAKPGAQERTRMIRVDDGRASVRKNTATVRIDNVDRSQNQVTFTGPRQQSHTVTVTDPQMQRRLENLQPGDTIQVTYTEATAVQLKPTKNNKNNNNHQKKR